MPVVMERDHVTIILIDTGSGNDGTAKVTANVFCDNPGITFIGLGENIETMFMLKNEYISKADIRDNNTAVMIKRLEIGESVVLNDITLQHRATQEQSVILCMGDLERLGRIRIDDKKRMLVIYK